MEEIPVEQTNKKLKIEQNEEDIFHKRIILSKISYLSSFLHNVNESFDQIIPFLAYFEFMQSSFSTILFFTFFQ
jgi:hypothetical protein